MPPNDPGRYSLAVVIGAALAGRPPTRAALTSCGPGLWPSLPRPTPGMTLPEGC